MVGGPGQEDQSSTPSRRIGPYEQSLLDSRERIEAATRQQDRKRRRRRVVAVVAALAVAGGAAYGGWTVLSRGGLTAEQGGGASQPTSCAAPKTVHIAVAPVIAPAGRI